MSLLFFLGLISPFLAQIDAQSYGPSSRTIKPYSVFRTSGNVTLRSDLSAFTYTLTGPNTSVAFDFGHETAGLPTFLYHDVACGGPCPTANLPSLTCTGTCQGLGLAYSESTQGVGPQSDLSTLDTLPDGTVFMPILSNQAYTPPVQWSRGGFRYLTLSLGSTIPSSTTVTVGLESIYYTAAPDLASNQLNSYTGSFNSSDPLLNEIWYAGANTLQLCSVAANSSVQHTYILAGGGWAENAQAITLDPTDVFLADGAKRDRNPWAGDLSVALRTALTAQNYANIRAVRNSIQECIILQDTNLLSPTFGYFPYAGSPLGNLLILAPTFLPPYGSDTYHLYTINAFAEYVLVTRDTSFFQKYWAQILTGITVTGPFVQSDGLFNGTRTLDWGRIGQGGKNAALNALYYETLNNLVALAAIYPQIPSSSVKLWTGMAQKLKDSFNQQLWDETAGLYRDNTTVAGAMVFPQDGNSLAIRFNLTNSPTRSARIANGLATRLTQYGAPAPELPGSISPYIGSHELAAQFDVAERTGDTTAAMALMKTQWGYMRQAFSNASFIEGYASNGTLNYGFYVGAPTFISLAHAWSTGPVYNLVRDVVGIRATPLDVDPADGSWAIKPTGAFSDLNEADASVAVPLGKFNVKWAKSGCSFQLSGSTPPATRGTIYIPVLVSCKPTFTVRVNGKIQQTSQSNTTAPFLRLSGLAGGKFTVVAN